MSQIAFGSPDGKRSRHDVIDDFQHTFTKSSAAFIELESAIQACRELT